MHQAGLPDRRVGLQGRHILGTRVQPKAHHPRRHRPAGDDHNLIPALAKPRDFLDQPGNPGIVQPNPVIP